MAAGSHFLHPGDPTLLGLNFVRFDQTIAQIIYPFDAFIHVSHTGHKDGWTKKQPGYENRKTWTAELVSGKMNGFVDKEYTLRF